MKGKLRILLLLFVVALLSLTCTRERVPDIHIPSVSLSIITEGPITIADPIDISLNIYHRKKDEVQFPEEGTDFLPFSLYEHMVKQTRLRGDTVKTMVIYTVTLYNTGEFSFGPLQVQVGNEVFSTERLDISVLSVIPKNDPNPKMKDIVPPYRPKMKRIIFFLIPLALIGAASAFYFLRRYIQKRKQKIPDLVFRERKVDPYKFSIARLRELTPEQGGQSPDVKSIYSKISIVLRYFIGSTLDFSALTMTTGEIKRHFGRQSFSSIPVSRLLNILKRSDMVKFAKENPHREKIESDITESIEIVEKVHDTYSPNGEVFADDV